jgi:hypothetical protein
MYGVELWGRITSPSTGDGYDTYPVPIKLADEVYGIE